jgi:hypothetical protein
LFSLYHARTLKVIQPCVRGVVSARAFKSLSAVARGITGTQWNGWLFFGLKNRKTGS